MKSIMAIIAALGLLAILGGCAHTVQDDQGRESTLENEARKSQEKNLGDILAAINSGYLKLNNEVTVAPADPTKPMTNVSVKVVQAADSQVMLALFQLCDMSRYKSPATIADVLIAMVGAAKEVAIKGLDQLPWYWGFDALKGALNSKGYNVNTGDNGTVVIASSDTTQVGRDQNTGGAAGSDRDKDKSTAITMTEAASE